MNKLSKLICISLLPLISTACVSTPDAVNPMLQHSESSKELSDKWSEGNKQFEEGNELIVKGKAQIEEGENNLQKGQAMVEEGEAKMKASETAFDQLLNNKAVQE